MSDPAVPETPLEEEAIMATDALTDASGGSSSRRWLFVGTILLGSFLLFLVQPMIARMALPRLGGAPAVWNSAMLVYQALLLGGYGYAHWLGRFAVRRQAAIHLGVLAGACLWLPIGLIAMSPPADGEPALWVPGLLIASIGPLFLAVSAQAPLMQRWFSSASGGADPYALYAASNIGSFGGLLAYPLLVEPSLPITGQRWLWTIGYVALILFVLACARLLPRGAPPTREMHAPGSAPGRRRILHWLALALVPSGLMLATTTFLTTDIVAVPLLWVMPLGLYLLSFSVAFADRRGLADVIIRCAPVTLIMFGGVIIAGNHEYPLLNAIMALALLFVVSVALHARMYELRPEPSRLTGFYLVMALGGALGGVFAGLIAPVVFDWTYEYPILILTAGVLVPQIFLLDAIERIWSGTRRRQWLLTGVVTAAVFAIVMIGLNRPELLPGKKPEGVGFLILAGLSLFVIGRRVPFVIILAGALFLFGGWNAIGLTIRGDVRTRSYFGVYTINDRNPYVRELTHGTTLHGVQLRGSEARLRWPTTYYVPGSGVGQAMIAAEALYGPDSRIGVVGLGTGTLACYARPRQQWQFFEIDPTVVQLSRDSGKFTFLKQCAPQAKVVLGDARLRLAEAAPASLDLIALDAFSSDAVPVHLLTQEAFATYRRALAKDGLLMVHISNRYLAMAPVVAANIRAKGWYAARMRYTPGPGLEQATASDWIALSPSPETIALLQLAGDGWEGLKPYPGFKPWTDDHASILPVLNALHPELAGE